MIILDTNVLSALMHARPDPRVVAWLDLQPADSIWLTTISLFEARFGIARLAPGRRRQALDAAFERLVVEILQGRILDFDTAAANAAADLAVQRERRGRSIDVRDTQIAGIALSRRARLATGNTRHFEDLAPDLVNPFEAH